MSQRAVIAFLPRRRVCVEGEEDASISRRAAGDWQAWARIIEIRPVGQWPLQPVEFAPAHSPRAELAVEFFQHVFQRAYSDRWRPVADEFCIASGHRAQAARKQG